MTLARIRPPLAALKPVNRPSAGVERHLEQQPRVGRDAGCLQALDVAAVPMRARRQLRFADEDDALAAPIEQVLRGERATGHVDPADAAVQLLRHLRVPDHDGTCRDARWS